MGKDVTGMKCNFMHMIYYHLLLLPQCVTLVLPQCCSAKDPLSKKTETAGIHAKDVAYLLKEFASLYTPMPLPLDFLALF